MKKLIIIQVSIAFLSFTAFSQSDDMDYRERLVLGLKVGTNFSNVYDTEGEDFRAEGKLGFAAGAFLAIPIGKMFGIQPEFLISQKGFRADGRMLGSPYSYTKTTTYIDVPILLAVKPVSFITLLAGPQLSFLVKERIRYQSSVTNVDQINEFENDDLRKNTLCFTGGLDINIKHAVIGARVGADVFKNVGDGSSITPRYKNVWFQATFGLRF